MWSVWPTAFARRTSQATAVPLLWPQDSRLGDLLVGHTQDIKTHLALDESKVSKRGALGKRHFPVRASLDGERSSLRKGMEKQPSKAQRANFLQRLCMPAKQISSLSESSSDTET